MPRTTDVPASASKRRWELARATGMDSASYGLSQHRTAAHIPRQQERPAPNTLLASS